MPALEAQLNRFLAANTLPIGVSVDSVHCHANWARSLGGVSFPLAADFHPKGAVAESYGLYLAEKGITDRATVIIDASGVVRYVASVTPAGQRDIGRLAERCEAIDAAYDGELSPAPAPSGLAEGSELYVKSACGFSAAVLMVRTNLHLEDQLPLKNVSDDPAAAERLRELTGSTQVPALITGEEFMHESGEIIAELVEQVTGFTGS